MSEWIMIGNLDDIPRLGARVVNHGNDEIAIFRTAEDELYALLNRCPHKGGPLSEGIVHGRKVACPLHNWNLDLAQGCALAPDQGMVPTYPVRVEDGTVWLSLHARQGCAA